MNKQDLIVIKNRTLILKNGEASDEVVLTDPIGGDMYFRFKIVYIPEDTEGKIRYIPSDDFHATIEIDTCPAAVTENISPARIGTYENKYPLYFDVVVEQQTPQTERHNVIVTFLRGKEETDGVAQ